jgi:hypothetical protein
VADCCFFSRTAQPETSFSFSGQRLVALAILHGGPVSRCLGCGVSEGAHR